MRGREFDVLMHMQLSLRASLLSTLVPATIKLGFDRRRARELQWLFTTNRIRPAERQHVMDALFGFAEKFDVYEKLLRWDIPMPDAARAYAQRVIPDGAKTLIISPCSSHRAAQLAPRVLRTGRRSRGRVARPASSCCAAAAARSNGAWARRSCAACEQPATTPSVRTRCSSFSRRWNARRSCCRPIQVRRIWRRAVGTPVVGLYAATNPARSGPYLSRQWCVDKYDAAARRLLGKPAAEIPWTTKIERPGVMDLITPDDVIKKLHSVLLALARKR